MKRILLLLMVCIMPIFSFGQKQDRVERMLRKMSVRDKVGQLFIVTYGQHTPDAQIEEAIKKDRVGGLIIMEDEMEHYANRMNNYQKQSRIPLVISIDGEWGASMRFDTLTQFPRNMQLGALSNTDMIYKVGRAMADQFRRVGVHINYAPTVDVNNNPNNPVIGQRSFGDNPQKVAKYGAALIRGMQDGGVWTSAKHFPGHGDTDVDSHKALPTLPFDRARLDAMELYPFQEAINQDVWMVMVGHLNVPALDPTGMPSSLSYPIITKLLKEEMGFKGIVITDALGMKGVSTYMPAELVPLASFKAGSDVLLMPAQSWHRSINNVIKAVKKGEISRERLDESVRKVLKMKEQLGLLDGTPFIDPKNIYEDTETKEIIDFIQDICDASVTMVKRPSVALKGEGSLNELIKSGRAKEVVLDKRMSLASLDGAKLSVEGAEYAVVYLPELRAPKNDFNSYSNMKPEEIYGFLSMWAREQKVILAIMNNPYVLDKIDLKAFDGIVIGYSSVDQNMKAVGKVLAGEIDAEGVLPVSAGGLPNGFSAK
ncbi:MAG: hypothetical protein II315_00215 [Rikenellaceae bacterium]|nr:hypothetical protein [Rikenellaceae bacterium]